MDVSGLVITGLSICFEITSTLYSYGKQVKGARRDIQNLSSELFGLIGALEHLKSQQEQHATQELNSTQPPAYSESEATVWKNKDGKEDNSAKDFHQENVTSVLKQTIEFLRELQQELSPPKTRLKAVVQLMKWPLRESVVQQHLTRLERVKTFFVLSLVTDEVDQSRKTADEISALRTLIQDATLRQQAAEFREFPDHWLCRTARLTRPESEHQAMLKWLCPIDPSIIRKSIDKARLPGTSTWFTKSEEFQKQLKSNESSCFWLNGISTLHLFDIPAQLLILILRLS